MDTWHLDGSHVKQSLRQALNQNHRQFRECRLGMSMTRSHIE